MEYKRYLLACSLACAAIALYLCTEGIVTVLKQHVLALAMYCVSANAQWPTWDFNIRLYRYGDRTCETGQIGDYAYVKYEDGCYTSDFSFNGFEYTWSAHAPGEVSKQ